MKQMSEKDLDEPLNLEIVEWENHIRCAYLNDHRIVGGKPWAGGDIVKTWKVSVRELSRAIPALRDLLGLDYLGNPIKEEDV